MADETPADSPGQTIARLRARLRRLEGEVTHLRDFTRHPFADVALPDRVEQVLEQVREQHLTYLGAADLRLLAELVVEADRAGREGLLVEAGTALGGSAIVMAAAKGADRPMKVYDVFGMIPPPGEEDPSEVHQRYRTIAAGGSAGLGGERYYGYRDDLLGEVTASFTRFGLEPGSHGVDLVPGLFEDTIDLDEPVALAHLDGDWYASTLICLERLGPLLVPGGRLVLDDYYHWSGSRRATEEWLAGRRGYRVEHRAKVHVVREG